MADDLFNVLKRFHSEVLTSEFAELRDEITQSRRESLEHFDQMSVRFSRLESDYQALAAAVARLEARPISPDLTDSIRELRGRVQELEHRLADLESHS